MWAFLLAFVWASTDPCANQKTQSSHFPELQKKIEERLKSSANLVNIAKEADSVLAKLLTAKSHILISWMQKRELMNAPEEVIAQKWRHYYLENFILSRYPTPSPAVNTTVESLFDSINKEALNSDFKKKANSLFEKAKEDAISVVKAWPISQEDRSQIEKRLLDVKLYWFENLKGSRYQNKALEFLKWGVAYDPAFNDINMGVESSQYPTDENLYAVFLHEMGHALDSCRWKAFLTGENPFAEIQSCLRSANSVNAASRDDSRLAEVVAKKVLTAEMAQSLKDNPTCNRINYPPSGTQKDQSLESFADWFSAEVYGHSSLVSKMPRPDLCQKRSLEPGSSYPKNEERLQRIYLAHPKIAEKSGYSSQATHCFFSKK